MANNLSSRVTSVGSNRVSPIHKFKKRSSNLDYISDILWRFNVLVGFASLVFRSPPFKLAIFFFVVFHVILNQTHFFIVSFKHSLVSVEFRNFLNRLIEED